MLREQLDSVDTSVNMALGDTPNDAHIRTMFDILCGSVQAMDLDEASWIELVVGRLLFRAPYSNQVPILFANVDQRWSWHPMVDAKFISLTDRSFALACTAFVP